jgi:hypothetical protein
MRTAQPSRNGKRVSQEMLRDPLARRDSIAATHDRPS